MCDTERTGGAKVGYAEHKWLRLGLPKYICNNTLVGQS